MRLINEIKSNFTIIPNYILYEKTISLKAIGLYCKMASLPSNWRFNEEGLYSIVKDGRDSTRTALKELEELGLFYRFQSRKPDGKAGEVIFYLSPTPLTEEEKKEIKGRFKPLEIINTPQGAVISEFQPSLEKPISDNSTSENLELYNTYKYNIQEYNIEKEKIYKKEKDSKLNNTYEDEFEKLWKLYPRKEGKQVAHKVYLSLRKKNEVSYEQVEKGILAYIQELKRNRTQDKFILHGSTYFNQRRWEDELPEVENKTEKQVTEEEQDFFDRFE